MVILQWKDRYLIGGNTVAKTHRELMELIDRSYVKLVVNGDRETVGAFFDDLYRCISAHFILEEWFMRAHGYDQLAEHKSDHERILDEICGTMDELEVHEVALGNLGAQLSGWFAGHFQTHDARLHKMLWTHH